MTAARTHACARTHTHTIALGLRCTETSESYTSLLGSERRLRDFGKQLCCEGGQAGAGLATGSGEDRRGAKTFIRLQPRRWQLREGPRIGLKPGVLSRETEVATPECGAYCHLRVGKGCVTLCAVSQGPWPAHQKPGQ